MKVLVVDGGHGGRDPGAIGHQGGKTYFEKFLAWDLAELLRLTADEEFEDIKVVIVPHNIRTLSPNPLRFRARVAESRKAGATHFVSIHWNSAVAMASGTETWVRGKERSKHIAWAKGLAMITASVLEIPLRGVKDDDTNRHGGLGILKGHLPGTQACLLEVGFINNPGNIRSYEANRVELAREILNVVRRT